MPPAQRYDLETGQTEEPTATRRLAICPGILQTSPILQQHYGGAAGINNSAAGTSKETGAQQDLKVESNLEERKTSPAGAIEVDTIESCSSFDQGKDSGVRDADSM